MFPAGAAGLALVVLRAVIGLTAFSLIHNYPASKWPEIQIVLATGAGASLLLGLMTPFSSMVCCLLELHVLAFAKGADTLQVSLSALSALSIAVLGPGAYSLDAKFFGRKLIVASPPKSQGHS